MARTSLLRRFGEANVHPTALRRPTMLRNKFMRPLVVVACLATLAYGDDDQSFGNKIPPSTSRGPRDVSTLSLTAPSSNYGAPGTPPPFRDQNSFGQQPAFRPPPPPTSYGPPQNTYGPPQAGSYRPPPQNAYRPPPPQNRPAPAPSGSYGAPANNFGGQYGGGSSGQGHHEDHSQWVPQPYEFSYSVVDAYTGNDYSHSESGDGSGSVRGEYRVLLPDGRTQVVTYTATDQTGFNAQVTYQGEAKAAVGGPAGGNYAGGGAVGGGYSGGGGAGGYAGQGGYNQGQQHHHQQGQQHHSSSPGFHQGPYRK